MSEEWGPWIEHDGKGCPCVGKYVQTVGSFGTVSEGRAGRDMGKALILGFSGHGSWDWSNDSDLERVIRYRIRKPRGLTILEQAADGVKETEKETT